MSFLPPARVALIGVVFVQLLNMTARADQNAPKEVVQSEKMEAAQKMVNTIFSYEDVVTQMTLVRETMEKRQQGRGQRTLDLSPAQKALLKEAYETMTPIAASIAVEKLPLEEIELVTRYYGPTYQKLEKIFITDTPEILAQCKTGRASEPKLEFPPEKLSAARKLVGSLEGIRTGSDLQDCVYNRLIVAFVQKLSLNEIQEIIEIKENLPSQNTQTVLAEMKTVFDREMAQRVPELFRRQP